MIDVTSLIDKVLIALPATIFALAAWRSSQKVHEIVNSQRTAMMAQIELLKREIRGLQGWKDPKP